jgi:RNA polymerase sigma-70 factor, ECF subfamily
MTQTPFRPDSAEARFAQVFDHLHAIVAYAARRGSRDPEGIAAEVMAIAWRKLPVVPSDNPRPWLFVTARNLLMAERRRTVRQTPLDPGQAEQAAAPLAIEGGDAVVTSALLELRPDDRELLLLVAWDDLTPAEAANALGISAVALRVRLFRARRRFEQALERRPPGPDPSPALEMESA